MSTSSHAVYHSDPGILAGTPIFLGTRVPIKNLFDYLKAGDTVEEFLAEFPSVSREQAIAMIEIAQGLASSHAHSD
jgi:uncharacterized protein (DUF433 family)